MKSIFAKAFAEAAILLTSHTLAAKTFAAFWSRVSPKLAEGVGYFEKHDSAGLEADKTFLERITFRDPEITRIVDGCLKEFLHSDVLMLISNVQKIEDGIRARQEQINAWKLASIAAPSTSLSPLKMTRTALARRIETRTSGNRDRQETHHNAQNRNACSPGARRHRHDARPARRYPLFRRRYGTRTSHGRG